MSASQRDLCGNIRALLADRGLAHRHLAEVLGLPTAHVSNRMNAQWWSRDEVQVVADFLEVPFDELLGESLFKDDPRLEERRRERRAESRRVNAELRAERIAKQQGEAQRDCDVTSALCCECGAMRKVSSRLSGLTLDDAGDVRGRMTKDLRCGRCGTTTTHALLRTGQFADAAEFAMYRPTREQNARRDLDKLIGRLRGFGVEVAEWDVNKRRTERWIRQGADCLRVEFDASKAQWRFDLHPGVPALTLLPVLQRIWKCVALDGIDSEEWEDYDITRGISYAPTASNYERSIDELLADLMQDENAIRRSIIDRAQGSENQTLSDAEESA